MFQVTTRALFTLCWPAWLPLGNSRTAEHSTCGCTTDDMTNHGGLPATKLCILA
jgi:hypothetical protein